MMSTHAYGFVKFAVPTATADAPAIISSSASRALVTPPIPMIGTSTAFATWLIIRTAIGNSAGPESPPVRLAIIGCRARKSSRIPVSVLIIVTPAAPASTTARAISVISPTFGESFGYTGTLEASTTPRVTSAAITGSVPNSTPPALTFGHEMLSSIAATFGACEIRSATCQ